MSMTIKETLKSQLAGASDEQVVTLLFDFVRSRGQSNYDESVTQIEHALQAAHLATQNECSDEAITAALFHDIGHLLLDEHASQSDFLQEDLNHEEAGANFLEAYFPPEVTEPIRLHVPAKRYLCTVDDDYYDRLSDASKRSYQVQGGKLSATEQAQLESNAGLTIAVELRRFDDQAKQQDHPVPLLEAYADCVKRCLRSDRP
jgi:phosphonate degradation associated HDIG domain protein